MTEAPSSTMALHTEQNRNVITLKQLQFRVHAFQNNML